MNQASLRDAAKERTSLPGVGNAGLLSGVHGTNFEDIANPARGCSWKLASLFED